MQSKDAGENLCVSTDVGRDKHVRRGFATLRSPLVEERRLRQFEQSGLSVQECLLTALRLECGRICSIHPSLPSMANPIARAFGQRVRTLRTKQGISQEELADRCGVHRTYMGRIERGETNITLTNIHKVARGLGVSVASLVDEAKRG